jgi:hypothetical protein
MRLGHSIVRLLLSLAGIAAMVGVYYGIRWLVVGISDQFGDGLVVGTLLTIALIWLVTKVDPESFYTPKDRMALAVLRNDWERVEQLQQEANRKRPKFSERYPKPVRIILYVIGIGLVLMLGVVAYISLVLRY